MTKKRIAIICGGPGSEHEVSCVSGGGVLSGIDQELFEPILIGITKLGKWVLLEKDYPLTIQNGLMPVINENDTNLELVDNGILING